MFNTISSPAGGSSLFNQSTVGDGGNRNVSMALDENGSTSYGVHRNTGGSPSSVAILSSSRPNNTWTGARVRFNSVSSVDVTIGAASNIASDTTTVTDDLSLHDRVTFGAFTNGQIAELAVITGVAVSDANYNAYLAGTLLAENITGATFAASLLTIGSGATTYTATTGQVLTINGTVTQGSSHPIARTAPDTTAPTLASAAVANGTPTVVNLVMSEAMDTGNVPAASAFTVSGHTVSSVAITGSNINLTVSAAFVNGEAARTVGYTQPGTNNARDSAGNLLANFTGQAITNNVAAVDTTAPTFSSAQVANAAPANIVITMSETLAAFTPASSAFAVSGGKTVSSVARSGATITLTCSAAYAFGDTITVTYTKPGTNMLQDAAGNQTASFGPSSVTNNISSGSTTRTWTPTIKLEALADETPFANWAIHAVINDMAGNLIGTKTGLTTSSAGLPPSFTSSYGSLATDYRVTYIDDTDLTIFAVENLRCV